MQSCHCEMERFKESQREKKKDDKTFLKLNKVERDGIKDSRACQAILNCKENRNPR